MNQKQPLLIKSDFTEIKFNSSGSLLTQIASLVSLLDGWNLSFSVHSQQFPAAYISHAVLPTENLEQFLALTPPDPSLPTHLSWPYQHLDPNWPKNQFDPSVGF